MPHDPRAEASLIRELLDAAREVAGRAYAPYSRFQVGCALVTASGARYTGCNVENASYGLTICAERNAITTAAAAEGPGMKLRHVAVIVLGENRFFAPCGACRQFIAEFAVNDGPEATRIHWPTATGVASVDLATLLPGAFSGEALR